MKISIRDVEVFRSIMVAGTTKKAAQMLSVSQPAISKQLKQLEDRIGFYLFSRTAGRLLPTIEAQALYREIERAYVSLEHISQFIEGIHTNPGRHLRVLATAPIAHAILPEVLRRFKERDKTTTISIRAALRLDLRAWLDAQQFDIAFTNQPVDYDTRGLELLTRLEGRCIFPKGHRFQRKTSVVADDIAPELFISMSPGTQTRYKIDRAFERAKVRRANMIEATTTPLICELVSKGIGVSVVDPLIAAAYLPKGVENKPFLPTVDFSFNVLFPLELPITNAARRLLEITKTYINEVKST